MSSVVISGDTSGSITLSAPAVSGSNTATLPAATGTVMVSGNMPAFSAYKSGSDQSFSSVTMTKVTFNIEEFDTNNNFASSTFTPTVAGYYQINWALDVGATAATLARVTSYVAKNGSTNKVGGGYYGGYVGNEFSTAGSALVYCNGSTDYVEIFIFVSGTSPIVYASQVNTWVQGVLVRTP